MSDLHESDNLPIPADLLPELAGFTGDLHAVFLQVTNAIDNISRDNESDWLGQTKLAQFIALLQRDLSFLGRDVQRRAAEHLPKRVMDVEGFGRIERRKGGSWKNVDWPVVVKRIAEDVCIDGETGELRADLTLVEQAVLKTLDATGRSSVRVGGITSLGLQMEDVARRDDAPLSIGFPRLRDWRTGEAAIDEEEE